MAQQITPKNDDGKVQARFSSLNATGVKTHRITNRTQKRKNHNTTPRRPAPSPRQKKTIQKTIFATTPTYPSCISSTIRHI